MTGVNEQIGEIMAAMRPLSRLDGPIEMVRQSTPNWFEATMGTGVLALACAQVAGASAVLPAVGAGLWWLAIGRFVAFEPALGSALGDVRVRGQVHLSAIAWCRFSSARSRWG